MQAVEQARFLNQKIRPAGWRFFIQNPKGLTLPATGGREVRACLNLLEFFIFFRWIAADEIRPSKRFSKGRKLKMWNVRLCYQEWSCENACLKKWQIWHEQRWTEVKEFGMLYIALNFDGLQIWRTSLTIPNTATMTVIASLALIPACWLCRTFVFMVFSSNRLWMHTCMKDIM